MQASPMSKSSWSAFPPATRPLLTRCRTLAPALPARADHVEILDSPSDFYAALLRGIRSARKNIHLTTLYVGHDQHELAEELRAALCNNPNLRVNITMDYLRGTRGSPGACSALLLAPLIRDYPDRMVVNLYHTPQLRGILKQVLPQRFNEVVGLLHVKSYIFDSTVIVSGANLNSEYFTNRQDRYIQFLDSQLCASFFSELSSMVGHASHQLLPSSGNDPTALLTVPPKDTGIKGIHAGLEALIARWKSKSFPSMNGADTWIFPTIQYGFGGIRQDQTFLAQWLGSLESGNHPWNLHLTSGYLNFPEWLEDHLLKSNGNLSVLCSSPQANGFYKSKGISRHLPPAYTYLEQEFLLKYTKYRRSNEIKLFEYSRPQWTYHAKGLWAYPPKESLPKFTFFGSSNYGRRSFERDVEAQVCLATSNQDLRHRIHKAHDLRN